MDEFKEIQNSWSDQNSNIPNDENYKSILSGVAVVSKNYKGNQLILLITAVGLLVFAIAVSGFATRTAATGFILMIGSLVVRIAFEAVHNYRLKQFDITKSSSKMKEQLVKHYNQRKWVHYVVTPLCLLLYSYSFYILLPSFKMSLSEGFYAYILISGPVILVLLTILLIYVITKETKQHRQILSCF